MSIRFAPTLIASWPLLLCQCGSTDPGALTLDDHERDNGLQQSASPGLSPLAAPMGMQPVAGWGASVGTNGTSSGPFFNPDAVSSIPSSR